MQAERQGRVGEERTGIREGEGITDQGEEGGEGGWMLMHGDEESVRAEGEGELFWRMVL
jgi:hypothetical protein